MKFPHSNIKTLIFYLEKYKSIYFRVPKVASTSILMTLRKIDNVELCLDYDKSLFKFAFVRNPFDRLASCFRHVIQKGSLQNIQDDVRLHKNMSFEEFVNVILDTKIEDMDIHFRPQYTFIPDEPDFLGKFENLNEDFNDLCKILGIKDLSLLHQNKTDKTRFEDYYNENIIRKVSMIYEKDFELFNYSKKLIL